MRAEQAHAVPQRAYAAMGLFDQDVSHPTQVNVPEMRDLDEGGGWTPPGSTAQNGFHEVRWFLCDDCGAILRETHVDGHRCWESA